MSAHRTLTRLITLGMAAALAAGCSALPTQPTADSGTSGAALTARGASPTIQKPGVIPGGVTTITGRMQGNRGGTVKAGSFTLIVPPGAFSGFATISVWQPDPAQPVVVLSIEPVSKNGFKVPVLLVADLAGVDSRVIPSTTMSELVAVDSWALVPGTTTDTQSRSVTAPLLHFSTYRVDIPPAPAGPAGRPPVFDH
jgi:hypothetical protein